MARCRIATYPTLKRQKGVKSHSQQGDAYMPCVQHRATFKKVAVDSFRSAADFGFRAPRGSFDDRWLKLSEGLGSFPCSVLVRIDCWHEAFTCALLQKSGFRQVHHKHSAIDRKLKAGEPETRPTQNTVAEPSISG